MIYSQKRQREREDILKNNTDIEFFATYIHLSEEIKALFKLEYGINVDSDLFDPRLDFVSKRILTANTNESRLALISFLNAALKFKGKRRVAKVKNPVTTVENKNQKKSVFDVLVEFRDGSEAIIEIEFRKKDNFKKRSQFLISKSYASQDINGKTYDALNKRYIICVLNYTLFDNDEDDDFYREYMYRDRKGRPLTDDQTIIFVELTKLDYLLKKPVEQLTPIEQWALFFRHATDKSKRALLNKIMEQEEGIKMATNILQTISMTKEEWIAYEEQLLFELDQRSEIASAVKRAEKQGEMIGARAKEIELAKAFKDKNVPLDIIVKSTTLTLQEVEAL